MGRTYPYNKVYLNSRTAVHICFLRRSGDVFESKTLDCQLCPRSKIYWPGNTKLILNIIKKILKEILEKLKSMCPWEVKLF